MRRFFLATLTPVVLIILLFFLVQKSRIKTYDFKRDYKGRLFTNNIISDNPGIYQLIQHNGKLYGTDFRAIYGLDFPSMKKNLLSQGASQPIIGWGFHKDTILVGLANTKTIYYVDSTGIYSRYQQFDFPIQKIFVVNDSILLLRTFDSNFLNNNFCSYNLNTQKIIKLNDRLESYNDGGFATDGAFINGKNKFVHLQFNMGRFSVISKPSLEFSDNVSTIDKDTFPPPVIRFASQGFRLDKKFSKPNITAFIKDNNLYVFSNAYNKNEYYGGSFKYEYPVDVYDLGSKRYLYSFSIPRNSFSNGGLISVESFNDYIILVFLRKIIIAKI